MLFEHITSILLSIVSIVAGAFFGALPSKLLASKVENKLHVAFYFFAALVIIFTILSWIIYWKDFVNPLDWYGIIVSLLAIGFSIILFFFTRKHLVVKSIYKIAELSPIINKFTRIADKNDIKLFGGDLDFFGVSPADLDSNSQYSIIKSLGFRKVSILCEEPDDSTKKIRYGKICDEIRNVELRFYYPEEADLRVRGRIIKVNGSIKLLMYTKYSSGKYRALETDTADSSGALYDNIWQLAWSMARKPDSSQIQSYIDAFKGR